MHRFAITLASAVVFTAVSAFAQTNPPAASDTLDHYLSGLPANLQLKESSPQQYLFTCDYYSLGPTGDVGDKTRVTGQYIRGLPDSKVRWDNVAMAKATGRDTPYPAPVPQHYMDAFTYQAPTDLAESFQSGALMAKVFPPGFPDDYHVKDLVLDTHMLEMLAWRSLDKLKLNQPFRIAATDSTMSRTGNFHTQQLELTWLGVSKMNDKPCALIEYEAFFNRLSVPVKGMNLKGTSHFWGTIWLSLADKQIEYATLREGMLGQIEFPPQVPQKPMNVNAFRIATFQRQATAPKQ